jgi:anti-sigma B factor antagonist
MASNLSEAQNQDVIRLAGSVDLEHSPEIRQRLLDAVAGRGNIFVDLSEVTYIDSSGIACLVEALQAARNHSANLGLVAVSRQAMRVLELARLDMVFSIHDDLASALQAKS